MRVLHYYPRAWIGNGGVTSAVHGWASALANAGADVTVVSDGTGERPAAGDVRWISTPHRGPGRFRAPVDLDRSLRGQDLLVLHSGWAYHNIAAARSAARSRVPYLLMPHGAYEPNVFKRRSAAKRVWWSLFERDLVMHARAIHLFFEEQADDLRRLGYHGPIVIAPNGLTTPDLQPRDRRSGHVLWMGRFDVETKGLDLLLRALASLPSDSRPRARLHGPDWRGGKARTTQLVNQLGLAESVEIGPALYGDEKWQALGDCGVFVFPARWDGQSIMVLEAAAAGAPLVMTCTTHIGRQLAGAGAAILVEATSEALASGIVQGFSCDAAALGRCASALVRDRFSWPAVATSYVRQLEKLL